MQLAAELLRAGSGYFQASGLAPGEYRVFAVSPDDQSAAGVASAWQRLLNSAGKLALARGSAPSLSLRGADPGR